MTPLRLALALAVMLPMQPIAMVVGQEKRLRPSQAAVSGAWMRRFGSPLTDLALRQRLGRVDFGQTIVIGALASRHRLIGLSEAHFDGHLPPAAAIGVTVDPTLRGQGLGQQLVKLVVDQAFANGAFAVAFDFTPNDRPIARIAAHLGARVDLAAGYAAIARTTLVAAA